MSQNEPVMSERARFEAWFNKTYSLEDIEGPDDVEAAWLVWQAAWQARCPEGWQVVPKAQTDEMREAARLALMNIQGGYGGPSQWDAQLAAAPKPEDVCKSPD